MTEFRSNGKLLLTGEYLVLDGALALAIPTKYGQSMSVQPGEQGKLIWESYDHQDDRWLHVDFNLEDLRIRSEEYTSQTEDGSDAVAIKLQEILRSAKRKNPEFLTTENGILVQSFLEFPRSWGLGSSSTLVNNIALWSKTDPFKLQFENFGGSAYDIACAQSSKAIHYRLVDQKPESLTVNFRPDFKEQLYFVFLNKKQNSRDAIRNYRALKGADQGLVDRISELTRALTESNSIAEFDIILAEHETLIASVVKQESIQKAVFSDYFGQTKSLGAWGGDFILATGNDDTPNYFNSKGYDTVIAYQDMVL